jgi:hypothetical protein
VKLFNEQIDACAAAHPTMTLVSKTSASTFTSVGVVHYIDLGEAIQKMLVDKGQTSAKPSTMKGWARAWALTKIAPFVQSNGTVKFTGIDPLLVYEAVKAAEEGNSLDRAVNPRGANIDDLRVKWSEVQRERGNLDSAFLRPVKVDREPSVTEMKKHFGIPRQASLQAWGWDAIDQMAQAGEGPNGSMKFLQIARTLKYGIGVKKRFYFSGGGDGWSTNILVVMDEKNQLWGFSMGYSE